MKTSLQVRMRRITLFSQHGRQKGSRRKNQLTASHTTTCFTDWMVLTRNEAPKSSDTGVIVYSTMVYS
ncbi:hypothetical protein EMPG_11691 [Blastomyces silverae]|uniref:Uncharacterized protein n=1 Tax=Blastomyces silverae TaxID=2060906 RepID=A0A0H1BQH9_9EURO|nr:hypothetical protein EMPG_11691 [Blastomyces silverae]